MDAQRLKENFAYVVQFGDEAPAFFYADLFLRDPGLRQLFPMSMAAQGDRFFQALGRIVADSDDMERILPFVEQLGRDHRKFGVQAAHYQLVGESLLMALAYFSGAAWTAQLAADWSAAFTRVAEVMIAAARDDERQHPPWWEATVIGHERRCADVSVLRLATDHPLPFQPGQSVSVESPQRPRIWRPYSMANAPREDGTLDFHIRAIEGGQLSPLLTRGPDPAARLRLGAPVGTLAYRDTGRDVLLIAGSTGLAPLKAIAEQIAQAPRPPRVSLFFGARSAAALYDLPALEKMAAEMPWLSVCPAVSDDPSYPGERGPVADVVAARGHWDGWDAYVCGSSAMITATVARLAGLGLSREQIHTEDFGWSSL